MKGIIEMAKAKDTKQRVAYITAIIAFSIGWGLTIAGFLVPPRGEVDGSVLAVLGEAMVYTASVLGVTLYFNNQMIKFRAEARDIMSKQSNEDEEIED